MQFHSEECAHELVANPFQVTLISSPSYYFTRSAYFYLKSNAFFQTETSLLADFTKDKYPFGQVR